MKLIGKQKRANACAPACNQRIRNLLIMNNEPTAAMNTLDAIRALPKVELHVHTLGSLQPDTLLSIIREDGIDTPYNTVEDIVQRFQY
ncbi:MAG: hypothetical protein RTS72_00660, partial [Candidatus Thorarchaeota archaeon]